MKKTLNKKRIIIFLFILLIISSLVILFFILNKKEDKISKELEVQVEINSKVDLLSYLNNIRKEDIKSGTTFVDTKVLGEQTIKLDTKDKEYIFKVRVVDTTKPSISFKKELTTKVGKKIDLLENVVVKDNSNENITAVVVGEYDFNKEGTYNLKYVAKDSSENIAEEEFTLKVLKDEINIPVRNGNYDPIEIPNGEKELIGTTKKGYEIYKINGSIYIEGILIANKTYKLANNYVPSNTYTSSEGVTGLCNTCINNKAYAAWLDMKNDAALLSYGLWIQSGYRPQSMQVKLYNGYVARNGQAVADTYSSRPGHSEHQTGLSFDLNTVSNNFIYTKEGKWVNDNCYKYGYIIRFPKGKESETGYQYEPWHIRYVGKELATKLYNNGNWLSLEDYFGITSEYE